MPRSSPAENASRSADGGGPAGMLDALLHADCERERKGGREDMRNIGEIK